MPSPAESARPPRQVFTVSQLNREVRALLEGSLPLLWVEGEVSNLARPASGHLYFTLKDAGAQVRCAMFRTRSVHVDFRIENGMQVLARVRAGLYEPRGEYQLVVEHLEEAGDGALRRSFDQLKERLGAEGLFDIARKRPLPAHPRCIGVVTSPSGAAIRDILTVLRRRCAAIPVVIYPTQVQGRGAAEQIAAQIRRAGERAECDVLIVGRGGGSLEDLWAFNEEPVARAIHASPLPVVSAVGHEIDFTIADFVADARAPTPSAAAEMLSPDGEELIRRIASLKARLHRCMRQRLDERHRHLDGLARRLKHPGRRLQELAQRIDELELRLSRALRGRLRHDRFRLAELSARLARRAPHTQLEQLGGRNRALALRLDAAMRRRVAIARSRLGIAARALDAVSPLATLTRGYAIVTDPAGGRLVRSVHDVTSGDRVETRLADGRLVCEVLETRNDTN